MFMLRRTAVRAIAQPARQLSTPSFRPASRFTNVHTSTMPAIQRSFHQSLKSRADGQKGESPAETELSGGIDAVEPSAEEQRSEIREESIATSEVADAAQTRGAMGRAQEAMAKASNTVSSTVSSAAQTAFGDSNLGRSNGPDRSDGASSKILYIGNLFFEVTASQLETEFARYGTVKNCRIVTDARGQSKGFGYIELSSKEEAESAIAASDQKVFEGRRMSVQFHIPRERPGRGAPDAFAERPPAEPSKTLFIGNMSYQMSDRDLNDLFREIRNVLDVRVAIDRRSGQPRGFAHADFIDIESAANAKTALESKVVFGRQLRVDYSRSETRSPRPSQD